MAKTDYYRTSDFNEDEQSILSEYLDTEDGKEDNTLTSGIKINIEKLYDFLNNYVNKTITGLDTLLDDIGSILKEKNKQFIVLK